MIKELKKMKMELSMDLSLSYPKISSMNSMKKYTIWGTKISALLRRLIFKLKRSIIELSLTVSTRLSTSLDPISSSMDLHSLGLILKQR